MKTWQATAPTNIALIKYMGKDNAARNVPSNASLSYTLPHLTSTVTLQLHDGTQDHWQPLESTTKQPLSAAAQQRFLGHLVLLKKHFGYQGYFSVRSANNFPADCGLASSASSFAALTECAATTLQELTGSNPLDKNQLAALSRQGSGSSCRSFFAPWAFWQGEHVSALNLPYTNLYHRVVIVSQQPKTISSREAHRRVATSALFSGRPERATQRLTQLITALQQQDWRQAYQLTWQEFWDMHALFETAAKPFGYYTPASLTVLAYIRDFWENYGDGPLVTLDAGPNVHLLFRPEQQLMLAQITTELAQSFTIL